MIALIIIIALLTLLMLIPLGVRVSYGSAGLEVYASAWRLYRLRLYPPKPKDEQPTEADVGKEEKPKKSFSLDFALDEWLELAKAAMRALRRFKNGITFGLIKLHCLISAQDPYDAVVRYNAINAFIGSAIPFFESDFKVKNRDILVDLDLQSGKSAFEAEVEASIRVGRLVGIALAVGFKFVQLLAVNRIHRIRERKAHNGKQQIERNDAVNNGEHQEPC